jgi:RNA polymerase sigma-70 factor (ECF subfamily)
MCVNGRSTGEVIPLIELLDERRHLLALAFERLGSGAQAEEALQRAYGRWFELAPQEREHISPVRTWLTRLVDRTCSDVIRSAPTAPRARPVGGAPTPAPPPNRPRRRPAESPGPHDGVVHAFSLACRTDNGLALDAVLAPSVTALVDGGGKLRIDASLVHGADDVSHFLRSLFGRQPELVMTVQSVNGTTGLVAHRGVAVVAVISLDIIDSRIHGVCIVLNPDKLRSWNRD